MIPNIIKGQFWSFDVLFALIIFSAAMTILAVAWLDLSSGLAITTGGVSYIMQLQAQAVAQNLMSPGSPGNWPSLINPTAQSTWSGVGAGLTSSLGSASLSSAKIYALQSMANYNYTAAGPEIGTTYNYYIMITGSAVNITIGRNPTTSNSVTTFIAKRSALLNGVSAQVVVYIWSGSVSSVS